MRMYANFSEKSQIIYANFSEKEKKMKQEIKSYTIKELMNKLRELVESNPKITLNTKVCLSDFNMSGFKDEIMIDPVDTVGEYCICLFHSLNKETPCQERKKVLG